MNSLAVCQEHFPSKFKAGKLHSEFTLGTAQLGMSYGVANELGMPSDQTAVAILDKALDFGVTSFDTARGYGLAEQRIGQWMNQRALDINVITKLGFLKPLAENATMAEIESAVNENVFLSCKELCVDALNTLLLHNWKYYQDNKGLIWKHLLSLKQSGLIKNLGTSVYTPEEAIQALNVQEIAYLQLPFNVLDHRWLESDFLNSVKNRQDVIIHVRSALLQGLLANKKAIWPSISNFDSQVINNKLDNFVNEFGRLNRADLCYAYLRFFPWITSIVVGVEAIDQLQENYELFQRPPLTQIQVERIWDSFSQIPLELLNPSQWKFLAR